MSDQTLPSLVHDAGLAQATSHELDRYLLKLAEDRVTDLHLEPQADWYRLRVRGDGILRDLAYYSRETGQRFAARLKVKANLNLLEHRLPQDGALHLSHPLQPIAIRISTCPTIHGEKIVLRFHGPQQSLRSLQQLGLEATQLNQINRAIQQKQGLVLVTGPTGSGKTATLYSLISLLAEDALNILSVEDPVECDLVGVNQINCDPVRGLSFNQAVRTFLRQDPDVIMVGEIRDPMTAQTACEAAMTGHLVLSSLHSPFAAGVIWRLVQLGLSPASILYTTQLIVAQRLVRCLCHVCKQPSTTEFHFSEVEHCYEAKGCDDCVQGYRGRTGIFEILTALDLQHFNSEIETPDNRLLQQTQQRGLEKLRASAFAKVNAGITSLDEIKRIGLI